MPAWNLFGNLFSLLTFLEERQEQRRDRHGRFLGAYSRRERVGLLRVPAFNEAVAALVAARAGQCRFEDPHFILDGFLKPPALVLSHDCDLLRGNDPWTQMVRAYRVLQPLAHGRLPRFQNLWWIAQNAVHPRRYYFENVIGMVELERQFGYSSIFYLLNGSRGRFGSRGGSDMIPEVTRAILNHGRVGIHYNYDTHLDGERFEAQRAELATLAPGALAAGRAHYLRFDPFNSFRFLESCGIRCDESAGYPDRIGYRCGIGGCFQAFDDAENKSLDIFEVPLTIMDETLVTECAESTIPVFSAMLRHLSLVGGALSLLVHPGVFHNPEFPQMLGLYHKLLIEARQIGAISLTAPQLEEMTSAVAN